jgi:hypothetical protein
MQMGVQVRGGSGGHGLWLVLTMRMAPVAAAAPAGTTAAAAAAEQACASHILRGAAQQGNCHAQCIPAQSGTACCCYACGSRPSCSVPFCFLLNRPPSIFLSLAGHLSFDPPPPPPPPPPTPPPHPLARGPPPPPRPHLPVPFFLMPPPLHPHLSPYPHPATSLPPHPTLTQVLVTDPKELEAIRQRESDITKERVQKILDAGERSSSNVG